MSRRLALVLASLLPLAAAAQPGPGPGPGDGPGPGYGPGGGRGSGRMMGGPEWRDPKRAKLALVLGLAEVLELDDAQALKLRGVVDQFEARRQPILQQQRDAMKVIRGAAEGEKVDGAALDQAIARAFDARAQLQAVDREVVQTITKDLPPQKKARAVVFLHRFQRAMMGKPGPEGRMGPRGRMPRMGPQRGWNQWGAAEQP